MKKAEKAIWTAKKKAAGMVTAIVFALCIMLVALIELSPGYASVSPAINSFFILTPERVTEEAIDGYAGVRRVYEFDMSKQPRNSGRGRLLFVYLRHTAARLEMGGKVYVDTGEWRSADSSVFRPRQEYHGTPYIGHTPGNYWLTLPIYADYYDRTVLLTLTPIYESVCDEQPLFLMIDREPLLNLMLLPKEGSLLALSLISVISGSFLALLSLLIGLRPQDRPRVFYLGATAAAAGLWKLCGLSSVPLLLDYLGRSKLIWYTGAASYLLALLLSLRLLETIQPASSNRMGNLCANAAFCSVAALLVLQMADVLDLHEALVPFGVCAAALHLAALFGQRPSRSVLLWSIPTSLALGADLLQYRITGSIATAPFFLMWILGNLVVRGILFLRVSLSRERALREERTRSMISQIRPHFIYNTMLTIQELCATEPQRASLAVGNFTEYLQSNFTAIAHEDPIPFTDELRHTNAYLEVESLLYNENLQVVFDTPCTDFSVPALTLQPIVENSIKHASAASRRNEAHPPIRVEVRTRRADGFVELTVADNGGGFSPSPADGARHTGLQNVRERLELMCGGTLNISSSPGGSVVTVQVPIRTP